MLILHFIGLAMGLGTSFAFLFIGVAGSKMEPAEGMKFAVNSFVLSTMGHIGLALLIVSGGYLMTPYWQSLGSMPWLSVKLVLVLVLAGLVGIIGAAGKRARRGDLSRMKTARSLGQLALVVAVAITVLAVAVFH